MKNNYLFSMKCLSWNIRGLESFDRKYIVRRLLNSHKDLDFVLLHEVKAINFTLETNLNFIWKDSLKLFTNHEKGKGGAAILINHNWKNSIIDSGVSPCNRAVWVTFQHGVLHSGCATYTLPMITGIDLSFGSGFLLFLTSHGFWGVTSIW